MTKLCECGCGLPAPLARQDDPKRGYLKGQPKRFIHGHQNRGRKWASGQAEKFRAATVGMTRSPEIGRKISETHKKRGIRPSPEAAAKGNANRGKREDHPSWKGGVSYVNGRKCIYRPEHHRAHQNGYVYEHILVAEQSLGRQIFSPEVVHHIDRDPTNNHPDNLMVISSQAEHIHLHREEDGNIC